VKIHFWFLHQKRPPQINYNQDKGCCTLFKSSLVLLLATPFKSLLSHIKMEELKQNQTLLLLLHSPALLADIANVTAAVASKSSLASRTRGVVRRE
jgi:hypothetical protein